MLTMSGTVSPDLGNQPNHMPEAEVALRLADFILSLPGSGAMASVAIDRASIKVGDTIIAPMAPVRHAEF